MGVGLGSLRAPKGTLPVAKASATSAFYDALGVIALARDPPAAWHSLTVDHPFLWAFTAEDGSRRLAATTPSDPGSP